MHTNTATHTTLLTIPGSDDWIAGSRAAAKRYASRQARQNVRTALRNGNWDTVND